MPKDWRRANTLVLVGTKVSTMSPCGKEEPLVSWAALDKVWAAGGGRWSCPSLLSTPEATPGLLAPLLGCPVQEEHGGTRESPEKGWH